MCGRYYMDDETRREIRRLVLKLDPKICSESDQTAAIFPSQKATVITGRGRHLVAEQMLWGFPRFDGRGILINARVETAMERHTFRESVLHRRCVIPAKGFWEWNRSKEKFSFERTDSQVLFMAGCYDSIAGQNRFVILTTEANSSVKPVHDRMPIILERNELESWVTDDNAVEYFLHKTPALLERDVEYEQICLF